MPDAVVVMVGLPARGKTYTARSLARYLRWRGRRARVFNVGDHRRERLGGRQDEAFFRHDDEGARTLRRELAMEVLDEAHAWLDAGGGVAIYDATNTTHERRELVRTRSEAAGKQVMFVEVISHDERVIDDNIRATKLSSSDYAGMDREEALRDFRARIAHYEAVYETIQDPDLTFVKVVDGGRQFVRNRARDGWAGEVARFVGALGSRPRVVWLTRHGESEHNRRGLIGGNADLSEAGRAYAQRLAAHLQTVEATRGRFDVWTSTLQRTVQTAAPLQRDIVQYRALDELFAGTCEGMTYAEIAQRHPEITAGRSHDKFGYRYPRGESYADLRDRLDDIVLRLVGGGAPTLIIGHQAVLRVLYAYLTEHDPQACPHIEIPLHTVIELVPAGERLQETRVTP